MSARKDQRFDSVQNAALQMNRISSNGRSDESTSFLFCDPANQAWRRRPRLPLERQHHANVYLAHLAG
jgi:hypothetical protein